MIITGVIRVSLCTVGLVDCYCYALTCRELMEKVSRVTAADLSRVGQFYVKPLFEPTRSRCAICCNPSKVDEITASFKE